MSGSLPTTRDLGRPLTLSVRRCPHEPGVPIDYALLSGETEPGASDTSHDAGFEAGYAAGHEAARAEAQREARLTRARMEQALGALGDAGRAAAHAFAESRKELEESVTTFAFALVETLVGRELVLADHPGRDAVARALAADHTGLPATARIHPDDADALCSVDAEVLAGIRELTIVVDEAVEPGGALVEIDGATIDSQLSTAVQRVRDLLIGSPCDAGAGAGGETS
jgi:flagellar assembly protein FliH